MDAYEVSSLLKRDEGYLYRSLADEPSWPVYRGEREEEEEDDEQRIERYRRAAHDLKDWRLSA
jgi:hypothetical protein